MPQSRLLQLSLKLMILATLAWRRDRATAPIAEFNQVLAALSSNGWTGRLVYKEAVGERWEDWTFGRGSQRGTRHVKSKVGTALTKDANVVTASPRLDASPRVMARPAAQGFTAALSPQRVVRPGPYRAASPPLHVMTTNAQQGPMAAAPAQQVPCGQDVYRQHAQRMQSPVRSTAGAVRAPVTQRSCSPVVQRPAPFLSGFPQMGHAHNLHRYVQVR